MEAWVWVLPHEAVKGGTVAGRTIIVVTNKKEWREKAVCNVTYRSLWPAIYQLVRVR